MAVERETEVRVTSQDRTPISSRPRHFAPPKRAAHAQFAAEMDRRERSLREGDKLYVRSFIPVFALKGQAMTGAKAPRHVRRRDTGRSAESYLSFGGRFNTALTEAQARHDRALQFRESTGEHHIRTQIEEIFRESEPTAMQLLDAQAPWGFEPSRLATRSPVRRWHAPSALLATSVVTAALILGGNVQSQAFSTASATSTQAEVVAPAVVPEATTTTAAPVVEEVVATPAPPPVPETTTTTAPPPPPPPADPKTTMINPVPGSSISSKFGNRTNPVTGVYTLHAGVDQAAPGGTPIKAAAGGKVTVAGWEGGYGRYTCIETNDELTTCYGHQSRIDVKPGQTVSQGDVIGLVGSTGNSTGNHLHFEVKINGRPVNPLTYVAL